MNALVKNLQGMKEMAEMNKYTNKYIYTNKAS